MTKDEALKMAIEVMENYNDGWTPDEMISAINACKEALEQPTVAELNDTYLRDTYVEGLNQPTWQGLTDDEINELHHKWIMNNNNKDTQYDFARAIEQALKEKNT